MSNITFLDQQGKTFAVPQERVGEMVSAGYKPTPGQTVTLADTGHKIPIESFARIGKESGALPRLESTGEAFERGAEERFGGGAGLAAGLGYGALQGATLGFGGKALMESGLVDPETLAQLEQARGGGMFSTIGAGEMLGLAGTSLAGAGAQAIGRIGMGAAEKAAALAAEEAAAKVAAERVAAQSLGERTLRSAGREALLGGAYGAGSELTQAKIEGRAARPLEAAGESAAIGGVIGGAVPFLGAAAGKVAEKRAAAKALEAVPTELEAAQAAEREAKAHVSEKVGELFREGIPAVNEYNAIQEELLSRGITGDLGKAIKSQRSSVEKLNASMDKLWADVDNKVASASFMDKSDQSILGLAKEKLEAQKALFERQSQLSALNSEREAAKLAKKSESVLASYDARITRLTDETASISNLMQANEALATSLARQDAVVATKLGVEAERIAMIGEHLGEGARAAAEAASETTGRAMRAAAAEHEALGVVGIRAGSPSGKVFARTIMEAADNPAAIRTTLMDAATLERMGQSGLVHDILRQPGVVEAITDPHAAAFAAQLLKQGEGTIEKMRPHRASVYTNVPGRAQAEWEALANTYAAKAGNVLGESEGAARHALTGEITRSSKQLQELLGNYQSALKPIGEQVTHAPAAAVSPDAFQEMVNQRVASSAIGSQLKDIAASIDSLGKNYAEAVTQATKAERKLAGASGRKAEKLADKLAEAVASRDAIKKELDEAQRVRMRIMETSADKADVAAANRVAIAQQGLDKLELSQAAARAKRAEAIAQAGPAYELLGQKAATQERLLTELEALKTRVDENRAALGKLFDEGFRVKKGINPAGTAARRLVPDEFVKVENAKLRAFFETQEGRTIKETLEKMGAKPAGDDARSLAAALGAEVVGHVIGHGFLVTMLGAFMGSKLASTGGRRAAELLMNPVRWYGATNAALDSMAKLGPAASRMASLHKSYTMSPAQASSYVESILADRKAIEKAFDDVAYSVEANAANVSTAKKQFIEAANYLEKKRPPNGITNGSDANAFARAVSILRNPDLLAKFVKDGSVRPQDVEVLRMVSPESYEQLKKGVELLHFERPQVAARIAPAFGVRSARSRNRVSISMSFAQALSSGMPVQEGPMVAKSETMAAAARPGRESSIVQNSAADAGFGQD